MKRIVLFVGLLFTTSLAFSQFGLEPEKEKVVEEINGVTHIEYYAILHNDVKVRTGVWKLIDKEGKVVQKIKYRNDRRIWIECPEEDRYYYTKGGRL